MSDSSDSEDLIRRCQWCGSSFRLGAVGRRAVYCRRSCRQRAYEARREAQRIEYALAMAADSSRDRGESTRDEVESGPVAKQAGGRGGTWAPAAVRVASAFRQAARQPGLWDDTQPSHGETRADTE